MISLERPSTPDVLAPGGRGDRATMKLIDQAERAIAEGRPPLFPAAKFDGRIYGHADIRSALQAAQHGKCCYCESQIRPVSPEHVDHYRPKSGRDGGGAGTGYYWLAYAWENLLFACPTCNGNKSDLFPLDDPADAATDHRDDLTRERPLLVNPFEEDPRAHLRFDDEVAVPKTTKGRTTIDLLKLNDDHLAFARHSRIQTVREAYRLVALAKHVADLGELTESIADAARRLADGRGPAGEYSAAVNAALASDI